MSLLSILNTTKLLFVLALASAQASAAQWAIFPTRVVLEKRAAIVNVQNTGVTPFELKIADKDGGDWLVAGPQSVHIKSGDSARIKVGRTVERGASELRGRLTLETSDGGRVSFPVIVPAGGMQ